MALNEMECDSDDLGISDVQSSVSEECNQWSGQKPKGKTKKYAIPDEAKASEPFSNIFRSASTFKQLIDGHLKLLQEPLIDDLLPTAETQPKPDNTVSSVFEPKQRSPKGLKDLLRPNCYMNQDLHITMQGYSMLTKPTVKPSVVDRSSIDTLTKTLSKLMGSKKRLLFNIPLNSKQKFYRKQKGAKALACIMKDPMSDSFEFLKWNLYMSTVKESGITYTSGKALSKQTIHRLLVRK